jgi:alpha-galactosidase
MEAMLTNVPYSFNGNVLNTGLITNLPQGCCVEVPCLVDARGVHPCYVGDLPPQLAALNRSNIAVQELAVRAVLDRNRETAFHACALDPLTAAVLPLHKIREMFDELWAAEEPLLKWFDRSHTGPLPEMCAR